MTFRATFTVRGEPKAQPRPRAFARKMGDKYVARVFEAGTAEAWKSAVVAAGEAHRPSSPLECPLKVSITFRLKRPKRLMRKRDEDGEILSVSKPDLDNLAKAVWDALTQDGWMRDDAQIVRSEMVKKYHAKDGAPGATVTVEAIQCCAT